MPSSATKTKTAKVPEAFVPLSGELVRRDAVVRLCHQQRAGVMTEQYFVHLADGSILNVTEDEFDSLWVGFTEGQL